MPSQNAKSLLFTSELVNRRESGTFALPSNLIGSQGHDVRLSEETGGGGERLEYPRTYHAQMMANAKAKVLPREWLALMMSRRT